MITLRRFLVPSLVAALAVALSAAGPAPLRQDADLLKQKLAAMSERGAAPLRQPVRTTVTEREVNAYLAFETAGDLPAGVVDPSVSRSEERRVGKECRL